MVLVQVMSIVSEDQIGVYLPFQSLKQPLDLLSPVREKALLESLDNDRFLSRILQKAIGARQRLILSLPLCTKHNPCDIAILGGTQEAKDCSPTTDFDVIRMSSQTK